MKSDLQAKMKVREKLGVVDVNSLRGVRALGGNIREAHRKKETTCEGRRWD